jgi:hypothetical protein
MISSKCQCCKQRSVPDSYREIFHVAVPGVLSALYESALYLPVFDSFTVSKIRMAIQRIATDCKIVGADFNFAGPGRNKNGRSKFVAKNGEALCMCIKNDTILFKYQ